MAVKDALMDTSIALDFFAVRQPFYQPARTFLLAAAMGEYRVWVSVSQVTDLYYALTHGSHKMACEQAKDALKKFFRHVNVATLGADDVARALASNWDNFEDALVYQCALNVKAHALITRNKSDYVESFIPVYDCIEWFDYLKESQNLSYEDISLE